MGENLAYCHNLVEVNIIDDGYIGFGDAALALMCAGCSKLEDVSVNHGETLTINGLFHAASICPLLSKIILETDDGNRAFSTRNLDIFAKRCPTITLREWIF